MRYGLHLLSKHAFSLFLLLMTFNAHATVLRVPEDYASIWPAINASHNGDTVLVAPGTYTGDDNKELGLLGKSISVIGETGSQETVIDCEGDGHGFLLYEFEATYEFLISGFTIVNAGVFGINEDGRGAGIFVREWGGVLTGVFDDIRILDCEAGLIGGIYVRMVDDRSDLEFSNIVIRGCSDGALYVNNEGSVTFRSVLIAENTQGEANSIVNLFRSSVTHPTSLEEFSIVANEGVALRLEYGEFFVENSLVTFNRTYSSPAIRGYSAQLDISCSNVYGNWNGNYDEAIGDQTGINGNISTDPRFCDFYGGDYTLDGDSPCLPENNDCGVQMGALGLGCPPVSYIIINGQVTDDMYLPLVGVLIGGASGPHFTDVAGFYLIEVPVDWSGTLWPEYLDYHFEPPERIYTNIQTDQAEQDFTTGIVTLLRVPGDYPTLQAAVDYSDDGDTILVAPGTYAGEGNRNLSLGSLSLNFIGEGGSGQTVIDCEGQGRAIRGRDILLTGFTILNGNSSELFDDRNGGGLRLSSEVRMNDVRIIDCYSPSEGGGLYLSVDEGEIHDLEITGCSSYHGGGACLAVPNGDFQISDALIHGNSSETGCGGIMTSGGDSAIVLTRVTMVANEGGALFVGPESGIVFEEGIIAFGSGTRPAVDADDFSTQFYMACSDVFANVPGDFGGEVGDWIGVNGNISADPRFCILASGDFTLDVNSPCLPENNDCGVQMGAFGEGCDLTVVPPSEIPATFFLSQNNPNPFNPETEIVFGLSAPETVTLRVYDLQGRLVRTLIEAEPLEAGTHKAAWNGMDDKGQLMPSGIYFYELDAGAKRETRKMTLLK